MAKGKQIQSVKGMHDILPDQWPSRDFIFKKAKTILEDYDFERIETPVLEETELFERGVGEGTDIVEKEMYSFKTKGGDSVTMRPEGTAPIVRAYIEHGMKSLPQPVKLYYLSPMFRHEQPQGGRLRQFWQIGTEFLGESSFSADAELIFILWKIFEEIGLKDSVTLQISSIGDSNCRPDYKKALKDYYKNKLKKVCVPCRVKYKKNVFRMLDCIQQECKEISAKAPQIFDFLDDECKTHFKNVLEFLEEAKVPYILNPYLVRGLDYYTRTVFEIWTEEDNIALAAGGRYDKLIETLGSQKTEAAGWAIGIERVAEFLKKKEVKIPKAKPEPKVFLAQLGDLAKKRSLIMFEQFRKASVTLKASFTRDSIKSQLRIANKLGVRFTLILGQREALDGTIILRDMESSVQETLPLEGIVEVIKKRLKEK
ncbi:MAG: histidine--tRNA ligase [Parcubacteria group bacterium Gr01-1014_2]|nr:MAG: histidine--tRNA ligase [Parcubacteria group bacterium Gr01-1014_2]